MNSKEAAPTQVYEDFVPSSKLVHEEHFDTIHLNLPGFKKDQMRIVLTSTGILKISGQQPIGPNKWQRFQKEFPVAENCDRSKISAKIENGILHVKQPKLTTTSSVKTDKELSATLAENTTSSVKTDKELSATLAENTPAAKRQKTTLRDEFSKQDNAAKEEPKKTSLKTSEQTEAKSVAENKLPSDESSSSSSSSSSSEYENESTDDDEVTGNVSYLAANLKTPRGVLKMTLVTLLILGVSLYVANE